MTIFRRGNCLKTSPRLRISVASVCSTSEVNCESLRTSFPSVPWTMSAAPKDCALSVEREPVLLVEAGRLALTAGVGTDGRADKPQLRDAPFQLGEAVARVFAALLGKLSDTRRNGQGTFGTLGG